MPCGHSLSLRQQSFSAMQASMPEDKIGAVAKALRAALLASDKGHAHFLRPILTSHAVLGDLEGALALIKQVKESQLATEGALL